MTQVLLKVSEYLRKIETLERFLVGVGKQRDEKFVKRALDSDSESLKIWYFRRHYSIKIQFQLWAEGSHKKVHLLCFVRTDGSPKNYKLRTAKGFSRPNF
jgi:hypothetical protein